MTTDVIVIGAGIMGLSTAYQITRRSNLNILILEKGRSLGEGSTGASSAVCRHRYSRDEMIELARDGILAYRHWSDFTCLSEPQAKFHADGVIWMNDHGKDWAKSERDRLRSLSIGADVLSHLEVRERFPALNTCLTPPDLETGEIHDCSEEADFLFESDGGYFEPADALTDLASAARRNGVSIRYNARIARIVTEAGRAIGVELDGGEKLHAGCVINTSGPWCNEILEPLGLANRWPLRPTRIQMIHIDRPDDVIGRLPVCCDMIGGIYFREQNQGQQLVVGSAREEDEREVVDPSNYPDWVDDDFKAARLHALQHRLPALTENIRVMGYTGLYTVNQSDVHPVVGPSGIDGFYLANGFSGHGFKIGPAVGALLGRLITGAKKDFDTEIDPAFLAFDRRPLAVDALNVMA